MFNLKDIGRMKLLNWMKHTLKRRATRGANVGDSEALKVLIGQYLSQINHYLKSPRKYLWDYEFKVFSQFGEDGILSYLFFRIGTIKPNILEVGAGNFTECNSRFSVQAQSANAYLVDGRIDLISNLNSSDLRWRSLVEAEEIIVTPENINGIIQRAQRFLGEIDLISLDIDGIDYWILEQINLRNVSLLVCEYNPLFGSNYELTIPKSFEFDRSKAHYSNLYYGMSLRAAIRVANKNGMVFIGTNRVGNNAFFIQGKLLHLLDIPVPDTQDLEIFCNWKIRESRDSHGHLTFLEYSDAQKLISNEKLLNLETGRVERLIDILF